jgi:Na+/H+ antiporter NhaD/arsenite permease-like protein
MSGSIVGLTYGMAALLALLLLYLFRAKHWSWHVASVLAAFLIGIMVPPEGWASQRYDLAIGAIFFFLCLWGIAGIFFRRPHETPHHG